MQPKPGSDIKGAVYVLDSFAVLAYLKKERAGHQVPPLLNSAQRGDCRLWMTVVNVGEVLYQLERERGAHGAAEALRLIESLPISIANADSDLTVQAAHIKARYPISYADCFAVALAQREGAAVVTGDPEFQRVESLVNVEWLEESGL
ncbi:MAG: type II toxin-antitoxin system VapC family toxin [Bacteroidetes bacterium]|nr:type II toxin-antitoxin system VapC family toxin [Bacteroidota bacterium]